LKNSDNEANQVMIRRVDEGEHILMTRTGEYGQTRYMPLFH